MASSKNKGCVIALDMDGTLLTPEHTMDEETTAYLIALQQSGVRLLLASGRNYRKLLPFAKALQMQDYGGFLVEVNGLAMYDVACDKRTILKRFPPPLQQEVFAYLQSQEVEVLGLLDDTIYSYIPESLLEHKARYRKQHRLAKDYPWTAGAFAMCFDNRKGYPNTIEVADAGALKVPLNKLCASHQAEVIEHLANNVKLAFPHLQVFRSTPTWLELMPQGVNKASGIASVFTQLNEQPKQLIVFGDGENDLSMFEISDISVAMSNAFAHVKAAASMTTTSNAQQGVLLGLKKIFEDA